MLTQKRPSISERTRSTPQTLSIHLSPQFRRKESLSRPPGNLLTPPISPASPRYSRSSIDLSSSGNEYRSQLPQNLFAHEVQVDEPPLAASIRTEDGILVCPYEVTLLTDSRDKSQTFGYGAWSTVYKGTCRPARAYTSGFVTPPSPPAHGPLLVAVKTPARKDAISIVESEARLLSHLMLEDGHERYVVPFYGMIPSDSSLVMAALPTSLDQHIRASAKAASATRTTLNMTQPVIGSEKIWLSLAYQLISALSWLHNEAMVIHGDIKPANILLNSPVGLGINEDTLFPHHAVLCDFSSSQLINAAEPTPNTLSAVTKEYTAPELLSSKVLQDPNSTATTASDVFSLAVTLLVAATGNTMVYPGSGYQRQAMATQGWGIIGIIRSIEEGIRVPRQGIVERVIEKAVLKHNMGRIDASVWEDMVDKMMHGDPTKQHMYNDSRMI